MSFRPFYNCEIYYNKNVLIPRKETEFIVDEALKLIPSNIPYSILDLGTGSGCISIAILDMLQKASQYYKLIEITGVDITNKALEVAKINSDTILNELKSSFKLIQSDLFANIPQSQKFDLILANLPYIPHNHISSLPHSVQKEPHIALDGGNEGIEIIFTALKNSLPFLKQTTTIILEADPLQFPLIIDYSKELFPNMEYLVIKDYSQNDRIIKILVNI